MIPGLEFLERCAGETGFRTDALEKVVRLGEVMDGVARHPLLGRVLVLKGGTALNLAFGEPTRLSVDLDFNFVGSADRQAMLDAKPGVEAAAVQLARRLGYRVQQSADEFAGRKLYLGYRSVHGPDDRIEVDLNYLMRVPIAPPQERSLWQPGGLDRPKVILVSPTELALGKLLALLDRTAVRDAWDVAHLPEELGQTVSSPSFRPWFVGMAAILPSPMHDYTRARFDRLITATAIEEQLVRMLIGGASVAVTDLVERCWHVVAPLLALTAGEQAYQDSFNGGDLRPELLFGGDSSSAALLASHPAIRWRLWNLRGHLQRSRSGSTGV